MNGARLILIVLASICLGACTTMSERGTLAELGNLEPDLQEISMEDGLERAAESYRRYLEETAESPLTPDAMRRLADLQIEKSYGILGSGELAEMATPEAAARRSSIPASEQPTAAGQTLESDEEFEARAGGREELLAGGIEFDAALPAGAEQEGPEGPLEAIEIYKQILKEYPNYERNDQVLYQMSRAYEELGRPDEAMVVMNDFVRQHPHSRYVDEVQFRRGEYYFVRKKFLDAEEAYDAIINMGPASSYYELALYKMGWTLYKQELYEEALHRYIAMLDHRLANGFDFDAMGDIDMADQGEAVVEPETVTENPAREQDRHRVEDTFRVISLSFSNLGGPEIVNEYFAVNGRRSYANLIYSNLAEFYFGKLRYADAASVYKSFIDLNPFHEESPHFSMRIVEIYGAGGFPKLVVEAKKEFATIYAMDAEYWHHFDVNEAPEVVGYLKTNLTDLANHYHALYQETAFIDDKPANFMEAQHWYREFLTSFPTHEETPGINYQLADLLLENENFAEAAREYERTAYGYDAHEQAAAAGYAAVFSHRQDFEAASEARRPDIRAATVESSLRFANTFPDHEEAPKVLGAAADDLYTMQQFEQAIASAQQLIDRYPDTENSLLRGAWGVIANSSIDLSRYHNAELAYMQLLALTPADDESRQAIIDGLAASIYKQGEEANAIEDFALAAEHFLRIKTVAPTSEIRPVAEYDAAAALIKLENWSQTAQVLESFRTAFPDHELNADATKQLAHVYREDGQLEKSAIEHERIARESDDPELKRAALLTAGDLYDEVERIDDAIRIYRQYLSAYPRPLDIAMETRYRLAEIFRDTNDTALYHAELEALIRIDRQAGSERTDRSRYLAGKSALVLAEIDFARFEQIELRQPFEQSLTRKQKQMDRAMEVFESLLDYEVPEVTAAATYYIAEIYFEFSDALMNSERPDGLTESEMLDYEMVIEEEAYPFEERAISVHEENFDLLAIGIYNPWVQKSIDRLGTMMPGRYAKHEISSGFLKSIDRYAYRMPVTDGIGEDDMESNSLNEIQDLPLETTAQVPGQ